MKKWKCKNCGKKKKLDHHEKHTIKSDEDKNAECIDCGEIFHAPICCKKKMYVAS